MRRSWLCGVLASGLLAALCLVGTPSAVALAAGPACTTGADALLPVICLPAGSGEDQSAPLGTGQTITFAGQVVNNGPAVGDATVVITLPTGLRIDPVNPVLRYESWWLDTPPDGTPLTCASTANGATVTCATGPLPQGANIIVALDLTAQADGVAGTSATFTVAMEPAAGQAQFEPTQVQATIDFTGTAHLQVSITPATATVTVGKSATLIAKIHNVGPNPAPNAAALGISGSPSDGTSHFVITNSAPLPGATSSSGSGSASASASGSAFAPASAGLVLTIQPASPGSVPQIGFWPVGTIAGGATSSVTIAVKAVSVGTDELDLIAGSDAADPACQGNTPDPCQATAIATLIAVAPVAVTPTKTVTVTRTATAVAPAPAGGGDALANTGFDSGPALLLAFGALLLGSGLVLLGRAPRRVASRH